MYNKTTLKNGVRIVSENIPYVRSASIGIWVGTGSRFETASENGAAHFIEHMLFKGTETRTASELAEQMDHIGGQINAFTTRDCTCFYGKVLDTHLHLAIEVLCDMFFCSRFDEADVKNERGVILEEIGMYEDTPEDLVVEQLFSLVYKGSSLARPILGKRRTLEKMTGESLRTFMQHKYRSCDIVVAISGSFRDEDLAFLFEKFSALPKSPKARLPKAEYVPSFITRKKRIEQNHICLAFPGVSNLDPDRFSMQLFNNIFGGGMSSRLFQELREKKGLCYSVGSFLSAQDDTGLFCITLALSPESEEKALSAVAEEIQKLLRDGVSDVELDRSREQVKANILMGLESTSTRMNRIARSELVLGRVPETEEVIAAYDAVTGESILRLAEKVFRTQPLSFSAVGRVKTDEEYKRILKGF